AKHVAFIVCCQPCVQCCPDPTPFYLCCPRAPRATPSFPTRRSSDLNTPRDALTRVETMIAMGATNLPERAMRQQISSAIQLDHRSEEHTSELQSRGQHVCPLLLEEKNSSLSVRRASILRSSGTITSG